MTRPADSASPPARGLALRLSPGLGAVGLLGLAVITLASPGATRMHAWPWSLAYAGTLLAPALMLVLRAFDPRRPLILPAPAWRLTALAFALVALASALASPYRGPSLLWSSPLLAGVAFFFVAFDALHAGAISSPRLANLTGALLAGAIVTSLALWLPGVFGRSFADAANARNPYPLGHSNYTAGLALLALPWLGALARRTRGVVCAAWAAGAALALVTLFTTGSRGGLLGLAALALAALCLAPVAPRKKFGLAAVSGLAGLALALAHPRTRAMFTRPDPAAAPNASNVERAAWLAAGWRMGLDRPLLGWGPGTTPLAFPRYRAALDGGTENVLQLHSAPAQLWAELGGAGLVCALVLTLLVAQAVCHLLDDKRLQSTSEPANVGCHLIDDNLVAAAAVALAGYAVFSLTDWQLDVPVFAFAVALCAALLAGRESRPTSSFARILGGTTLLSLAVLAFGGHPDPAPELDVRALALARDSAQAERAIALLRASLALNPDQEIAHFNLGWLLLARDPAAAETHFLTVAHLVPDKGGVYFGLGLARLNQARPAPAARAFALECLNDPAFLSSPWWREPAIAALRPAATAALARLIAATQPHLPPDTWAAAQLARVAALAPQLGVVPGSGEKSYRRERIGYPVLMRNLDLPTPVDLFDVRESAPPPAAALPPKGWLPSPLLLALLDAPTPAASESGLEPRN